MISLETFLINIRNSDRVRHLPIWDKLRNSYEFILKLITLNKGLSREIYPGMFVQVSYLSRHSIPASFEIIRKWDLPSLEYIKRHIQANPHACFMDIGAHHGSYSLVVDRWVGKNGLVIAFEPHPIILEVLKENLARNDCRQTKVAPVALGNTTGTMNLFGDSTTATLVNSDVDNNDNYTSVDIVTLDFYCQKNSLEPSVIKIDVEGFELEVLQGAFNTLLRFQDTIKIICEMHTFMWKEADYDLKIKSFLETCNLRVFTLQGESVKRINTYGSYVIAKNFD